MTKCLSKNALSQSWVAQRQPDGAVCFVKTIDPDSGLGAALQDAVLAESYRCQTRIRHGRITTATGLIREGGRIFVEYPYLDPRRWQPLDAATLAARPAELLAEIALLIDYLHRLGLVHCDLKLSNFLIRNDGDGTSVRMVDLDFLCPAGTHPNAKVFGTPDHIAPEILHNDEIYRQSDIFSIGVSLRRALDETVWDEQTAAALERLVKAMTVPDPLLRPRYLTTALGEFGLIDSELSADLNRRLLGMSLVTKFRTSERRGFGDRQRLEDLVADVGLLGLDRTLTDLLARVYAVDQLDAVRAFRKFLSEAAIQQAADYFIVSAPDQLLLSLMNQMGTRVGIAPVPPGQPLTAYLDQAREFAGQGHRLWGYLALRAALETESTVDVGSESDVTDGWHLLGELAAELRRFHESVAARVRFAERAAVDDLRRFPALYQVARHNFMIGRLVEAEDLASELLEEAEAASDVVKEVTVRRLQALIGVIKGQVDVDELVRLTISEVADRIPPVELALSHYVVADVLMRRGEAPAARDHSLRALELIRHAGATDRIVLILGKLVSILFDLGDYHGARHYALAGFRLARRRGDTGSLPDLISALAMTNSRLGNRTESELWDTRLEAVFRRVNDLKTILYYANDHAFARIQRGDLRGGKELLLTVADRHDLRLLQQGWQHKVLYNLAECAYWQGNPDLCDHYTAAALEHLKRTPDPSSALELKLIGALSAIYNRDERDPSPVYDLLDRLLERHVTYNALRCVYHLILLDETARDRIARRIEPLLARSAGSSVPLIRALEGLLPVVKARRLKPTVFLQELKEAFRVFVKGGQKFLAAVTGYRIAEQYLTDGRDALGQKYLNEVARIAESLENKRLHTRVTERIAHVRKSTESHRRLVQSIHGISQVLRSMGEYEDSLVRLVEFAVNETGAERGAMLLRSPRSSEFFVAAYYNCDEGSLGDITEISSRVPLDASRQLKPLVIDDATADARTREYQSVIEHNILSVICVPIVRDDETVGALYLDHHTIPALFEPDDITYIMSIANFMALVITSLRQYRTVSIVNRELLADLNRSDCGEAFVTNDPATLEMLQPLGEIALSDRPVLIMGESGTGKDVLARKIHDLSRRADKPLVHFNVTALPDTMVESELFGITRGAATGVGEREGKFMAADGGTLFFDEIGDMPLALQAKILTAVESQRFERVGSNRTVWVDVRFIYATNKDLPEMVKDGTFRLDLYQRMNFFTIEIPPLRARAADIPLLIDHFIRSICRERPAPRFSRAALEALAAYEWPGNVRELKNLVERFCIVHPGKEIGVSLLPRDIQNVRSSGGYGREVAEAAEKARMAEELQKSRGNISRAARGTGMPLSTFRRRARKYGLI